MTSLVSLIVITSKLILIEFKRYSISSIFFEREQEFIWLVSLFKGYLRYKTILCHKVALDV